MKTDMPTSLPEIDRVEVVDLRGVRVQRVNEYMSVAASTGAPFVSVEGEQARRISGLWRELPPGVSMRCHDPVFGFRFYAGDDLVAEASVCWHCNNLFGQGRGRVISYVFDASHPTSQSLLREAQRVTGRSIIG